MTTPLWSEEAGEPGAPLIALVHGSLDRSAGLLKLSRRLDDRCRVLRYDRRGYGRSAPHPGPFDVAAQVADLVALLDSRPAVVFGHSFGGNVALALADRHPELVRAVGIYEAPLPWLDWWPSGTAGGEAARSADDPADAAERFMRRMVGDEKWMRLPAGTRAARRTEGVTMVTELADAARRRAVGSGADHRAGRGDARLGGPRAPPPLDVVPRRGAARLPGRHDRGRPPLRAELAPRRRRRGARRTGQPSGDATGDLAPEERARRRVGGARRQRLADLVGAVLQRLALPPHDGGDADEDGDRDDLADDPLDDDREHHGEHDRADDDRRARRRGPW